MSVVHHNISSVLGTGIISTFSIFVLFRLVFPPLNISDDLQAQRSDILADEFVILEPRVDPNIDTPNLKRSLSQPS